MSRLKQRIVERLLENKNNTSMLKIFNKVNMNKIIELRKKHRDVFEKNIRLS